MEKTFIELIEEKSGYTVLDKECNDSAQKVNCIDSEGYKYFVNYDTIRQVGKSNPFTSRNPHTLDNIKLWMKENAVGFTLKSTEYLGGGKNKEHKLIFNCPNGHEFRCAWTHFRQGTRCSICAKENAKNKAEDWERIKKSIEEQFNVTILDDLTSNKQKVNLIDSQGYKYYSTIDGIKGGLRIVSSRNPYSIENIKIWLKLNNKPFKLLSNEYISNGAKNKKDKLCFECEKGHVFYTSWSSMQSRGKVCPICYHRYNNEEEFIKYVEETCGEEYTVLGHYINSQTKILMRHNKCGNEFMITPNSFGQGHRCNNRFCCHVRGEQHYRWNTELTQEEREKDRKSSDEYRNFIKEVLKRDNYTCFCCKSRTKLNVHHLDGYDWCKEKRTDVDNGITLCENCHKSFHGLYGYGGNTKEQWYEYISQEECG